MKNIDDPNILKKYIKYLAEMADSILSHLQITDNDYQSLFIESELFCKSVSVSNKLTSGLKTKLLELRLEKINRNFHSDLYSD